MNLRPILLAAPLILALRSELIVAAERIVGDSVEKVFKIVERHAETFARGMLLLSREPCRQRSSQNDKQKNAFHINNIGVF